MKWTLLLAALLCISSTMNAQKRNAVSIRWTAAGSLQGTELSAGVAGPLAGVHGEVLMIGGGANFHEGYPWEGGRKIYHNQLLVYGRQDSSLILKDSFSLPFPTAYGASCSTPQGVVYAGGENESGASDKVILVQWDPTGKQPLIKDLPPLPSPLANAAMTTDGRFVYFAGGETSSGASALFLRLNLNDPQNWEPLPAIPEPSSHAVMAMQEDGHGASVYLIGGRKPGEAGVHDFLCTVWKFDLAKKIWEQKAALPQALSAATGLPIGSNYVLIFGGDKGEVFREVQKLIRQAGMEEDPQRRPEWTEKKNRLLATHPGFSSEVWLYNTITDTWARMDSIPFAGQVTTTAVKWGEDLVIPSGEVRAGVRTPSLVMGRIAKDEFFSFVDVMVLVICFLLMTVARYFFTSAKTTTADYFKGGQRIPQWAAGISIFGAKLSAITFMGIPAKTYSTDWTYFFLMMTIIMIMPVVSRFFIPFYRKLNVTSAYEYLEKRFNYAARISASLLYILLQFGRMGIVILLPSIALMLVTGIDVYFCILLIGAISIFFTVKGGIEAVIWVEVVQVLILAGGALFCLFYIPFQLNWSYAAQTLEAGHKLRVIDPRFTIEEPVLWVVLVGGLAINLITYGTDQTTVQRYLTTSSETEARKSLKLGAWLTLPSTIVFFAIGTLLYLFFQQHPGQVNYTLENQDNIFPWYIVSQLPVGFAGLLIAGIFAAAMSSTEASMNSVATLITTDIFRKLNPGIEEKRILFFARVTTLAIGVLVTSIALYMAREGVSSLWDKFNTILGLFTGTIGGMFLLGIFTTRAHSLGVIMGMVTSFVTQLLVQRYTDTHFLLYAFTGIMSCVVFGYIFSLLIPSSRKNIIGLTVHT